MHKLSKFPYVKIIKIGLDFEIKETNSIFHVNVRIPITPSYSFFFFFCSFLVFLFFSYFFFIFYFIFLWRCNFKLGGAAKWSTNISIDVVSILPIHGPKPKRSLGMIYQPHKLGGVLIHKLKLCCIWWQYMIAQFPFSSSIGNLHPFKIFYNRSEVQKFLWISVTIYRSEVLECWACRFHGTRNPSAFCLSMLPSAFWLSGISLCQSITRCSLQ